MKKFNPFVLYVILLFSAAFFFSPSHITTDLLSIFGNDSNIQKIKTVNKFEKMATLFVVTKGFNENHKKKLLEIEKKLKTLPYIAETKFDLSHIHISDYLKKNYYLLSEFRPFIVNEDTVVSKLQELKEQLIHSPIYQPVNKHDPFGLFHMNLSVSSDVQKDGYLKLGSYGFMLTASIRTSANNMEEAAKIEEEIKKIIGRDDSITVFSTLFYMSENAIFIKKNVHTILYFSFGLLLFIFLITLKDYRLLAVVSISLASSIFFALSISTALFQELSIFTLAFGSAISSIAVDYLFHNYFHGQYLKKEINKPVLWGFLTTVFGFLVLMMVPSPLIGQLSVFAFLSLSFSYFQFTFLYPYFHFSPNEKRVHFEPVYRVKPFLPVWFVFLLSLLAILYSGYKMQIDYDLKNLDYDNHALKEKQQLIQNHVTQKNTLLIEAETFDELLQKSFLLQQKYPSVNAISKVALSYERFMKKKKKIDTFDFSKLHKLLMEHAKIAGFKDGYFSEAYLFVKNIPSKYTVDLKALKVLGYEIIQDHGKYYTLATVNVSNQSQLNSMPGVFLINIPAMIQSTTTGMFRSMLWYLLLTVIVIVLTVMFLLKKRAIYALNYIVFPIAVILFYLSWDKMNIMHLFSLMVIIVAGIDYGIYMAQDPSTRTKEAIAYSLLTSFAGFGVLVFSQIGAVHAIGEVITVGILSIAFLILFLKKFTYNTMLR